MEQQIHWWHQATRITPGKANLRSHTCVVFTSFTGFFGTVDGNFGIISFFDSRLREGFAAPELSSGRTRDAFVRLGGSEGIGADSVKGRDEPTC